MNTVKNSNYQDANGYSIELKATFVACQCAGNEDRAEKMKKAIQKAVSRVRKAMIKNQVTEISFPNFKLLEEKGIIEFNAELVCLNATEDPLKSVEVFLSKVKKGELYGAEMMEEFHSLSDDHPSSMVHAMIELEPSIIQRFVTALQKDVDAGNFRGGQTKARLIGLRLMLSLQGI